MDTLKGVRLMINNDRELLKELLPFWNKLSIDEQKLILNNGNLLRFKKGQSIHEGGHDCTGILVVISGIIRSFFLSESGKEITLFRLLDRDTCILSSSCILRDITFDINIEAEKDCEIYLIPSEIHKQLCKSNFYVKDFEAQIMASRLSDIMWLMEQVVFMSMDKRLANFLLEQADIEGTDKLYITHENIAKNLGTAREVITRMLKYFQNEDMVSLSRGTIEIIDKGKLNQILNY